MRKHLVSTVVLVFLSCCAYAQTTAPRFELFGGASYDRTNPGGTNTGANAGGWDASLNWNLNNWAGFKADVDGHYCCSNETLHNFMFGPQITKRHDRWSLFGHALVGVSHGTGSAGYPDTVPVWAAGGGLDIGFGHSQRFALRLVQADDVITLYKGGTQQNFRYSGGFVLRLRKK